MKEHAFHIDKPAEYKKAGLDDLVRLLPAPGTNSLFLPKRLLEKLVYGIVEHKRIHLSGPTGSAKTSLIEALSLNKTNFAALCASGGYPMLPLRVYPIDMATYETPGELRVRRVMRNGWTVEEMSPLLKALVDAAASVGRAYPLIWLREMGRVHSASVQGGLLDLMTNGTIPSLDGRHIHGDGISWIADSNYQAETDSTYTLVSLDDALKRRFDLPIPLKYLSPEQEIQVLRHLLSEKHRCQTDSTEQDLIFKVVHLGNVIRRHRSEGNLQSVSPPTISGYCAFLDLALSLPHLGLQDVAVSTLLGNASDEDDKAVKAVLNEVFGLHEVEDEELALDLF